MKLILPLAALLLTPAPLLLAHHSFAAEYGSKLITLNATITRFVWMNPHTRVYFDVKDAGAITKWECEGSSPGGLLSNGWNKESIKPGDHVTIEGFLAKDRANTCKVRAVKLANGKRLVMGTIGDFGQ